MKKISVLFLTLFLGVSVNSFSAGVTTHMYIGQKAVEYISKKDAPLSSFLDRQWIAFRRGTAFPDAAMIRLGEKKVLENVDQLSHDGSTLNSGESGLFDGKGHFMSEFARVIKSNCAEELREIGKKEMSGECSSALAYYLGIMNHLVADAPWHKEWVAEVTAAHCPSMPKKGLSRKGSSNDRHVVADHDLDICLASRLAGNPLPIEVVTAKSAAVRTGTKVSFGCPAGQFPDAAFEGCYSCESGYQHNPVLPVDVKGVCHRPAQYSKLKGTEQSCGKPGGWISMNNGKCYHCPSGYSHDPSKFGNQTGVCFRKTSGAQNKKAHHRGEFSISCPSGKFPGFACIDPSAAQKKVLSDTFKSMGFIGDVDKFLLSLGCPGNKIPDPATLFSCYKCPTGLTHFPQYNLNDHRVCHARAPARCDLIDANLGIFGMRTLFSDMLYSQEAKEEMRRGPIAYMKKAQANIGRDSLSRKKDDVVKRFHFDWAEVDEKVSEFFVTARKEPLTVLANNDFSYAGTGLSAHAPECDWMFRKLVSPDKAARGNINHSAYVVSRFLRHAWEAFKAGHVPELVRTGHGFGYELRVDGLVRYKY